MAILPSKLVSTLLSAATVVSNASVFAPVPYQVPEALWQPEVGDRLVIDTKKNEGFLTHRDGRFIRFPVVSGQNRWVHYIGLFYKATTPTGYWSALSMHIKGDRITYGPTGRFLRLYRDGEERTAYGIHEYAYEDNMFTTPGRYGSMGCIIVTKDMMDLIERTWESNGEELPVVTTYGIENLRDTMMTFKEKAVVASGTE